MDTCVEREMALVTRPKTQRDLSKSSETTSSGGNQLSHQSLSLEAKTTSYGNSTISGQARVQQGDHYGDVTQNIHIHPQEPPAEGPKGNEIWQIKRRPNALFVGQNGVLHSMETALLPKQGSPRTDCGCRQYVLHGIGGVGKSELALQFAKKHRQRYWGVFWVDFGSKESVQGSYSQILTKLGLSAADDDVMETVNDFLSNSDKTWLLVLDNCDDPDKDYQAHYPDSDQGTIIMTTRTDLGVEYGSDGHKRLNGLEPQASLDLLFIISRCSPDREENKVAAKAIVGRLEYHTLAIRIAGSLIGQAKLYSITEYAGALGEKMDELLNHKPKQALSTYETIFATFDVSAKRLKGSQDPEDAHALELLNILAFMDRTDISEDIFTRAWSFGEKVKERGGVDPDLDCGPDGIRSLSTWHYDKAMSFAWTTPADIGPFRRARSCLHELSLISCDGDSHNISMHPLLHEWARERLAAEAYAEAWAVCASTLALSLEEFGGWTDFTMKIKRHLEVNFALRVRDWHTRFSRLEMCRIFWFFGWQSYRGYSLHVADIANEMEKAGIGALDGSNPTLMDLEVLHLKANVHSRNGDHAQSLKISSLVLEKRRGLLPAGHERLLVAQSKVAVEYMAIGQPDQAVRLLEEAIDIETKTRKLSYKTNLAMALLNTGHPEEAVSLLQTVVEERATTLPPEHPDLLHSQHELALAHSQCDQWELSISILEHVVVVKRNNLARTNRHRFTSEYNLIADYTSNGQFSEARNLLQMIEEDRDAHLLSVEQRKKLQHLWHYMKFRISLEHERSGRILEAIREIEEIAENETSLPDDNVDKLQGLNALARQYLKNGQPEEARQLFEKVRMHQNVLPEMSRAKVDELQVALQKFDQNGQVPEWLFECPYHPSKYYCNYCIGVDSTESDNFGGGEEGPDHGGSQNVESEDEEFQDANPGMKEPGCEE